MTEAARAEATPFRVRFSTDKHTTWTYCSRLWWSTLLSMEVCRKNIHRCWTRATFSVLSSSAFVFPFCPTAKVLEGARGTSSSVRCSNYPAANLTACELLHVSLVSWTEVRRSDPLEKREQQNKKKTYTHKSAEDSCRKREQNVCRKND